MAVLLRTLSHSIDCMSAVCPSSDLTPDSHCGNAEVPSLTSAAQPDTSSDSSPLPQLPHNLHLILDLLVLKFYHQQLCWGEMTDLGSDIKKLAKSICVVIII